jgi:hypothetical protein
LGKCPFYKFQTVNQHAKRYKENKRDREKHFHRYAYIGINARPIQSVDKKGKDKAQNIDI